MRSAHLLALALVLLWSCSKVEDGITVPGSTTISSWCALDDEWETPSSVYYTEAGESTYGVQMSVLPSGKYFIPVSHYNAPWQAEHYISNDWGNSWSFLGSFSPATSTNGHCLAHFVDSSGVIFNSCFWADAGGVYTALLRRSTDEGVTWTTTDTFQLVSGKSTFARNIFTLGNYIFYNFYAYGSDDTYKSGMRRCDLNGANCTTVGEYQYTTAKDTIVTFTQDNFLDSSNNIYQMLYGKDSSDVNHALIRRSSDSGATWSAPLDDFQLDASKHCYATNFLATQSGNLLVSYQCQDSSSVAHWIIRKSTNGGSSWATIDNYQLTSTKQAVPYNFYQDSRTGKIYVSGFAIDSSDKAHGIIRVSTDDAGSWSTEDDYRYHTDVGNGTRLYQFVRNPSNNQLGVVGFSFNASNAYGFFYRKAKCIP